MTRWRPTTTPDAERPVRAAQARAFVESGFSSNGGEFLSYLHISESLAGQGRRRWEDWDRRMTENLEPCRNADGSWTGNHCIHRADILHGDGSFWC